MLNGKDSTKRAIIMAVDSEKGILRILCELQKCSVLNDRILMIERLAACHVEGVLTHT